MPAPGQGIRKQTVFKKQTAFGTPATGAGGQILRRRTAVFQAPRDTFESDELASHHQHTGVTYGLKHATGRIEGLLSPGTYSSFFGTLVEKVFVAGVAAAAVSVTIAGTAPTWTVTRAAGSWITDGFKVGDVIRLSVGALNAANIAKNLYVIGETATVLTVRTMDGSVLVAEGPIAGTTATVIGKKTNAPISGHTDEYYSFEEWYSDLSKSEFFQDMKPSTAALGFPPTGNSTFAMDLVGLGRSRTGVQQLTSPVVETSSGILNAIHASMIVNGVAQGGISALTLNLANGAADMGAVAGTNVSPGVSKGRIRVNGSFSALFDTDAIQVIYDAETAVGLQVAETVDSSAASDFIAFTMSRVKITGDAPDDGEKAIVRTYPFTAEVNLAGGAATVNDQSIISIQDSLA